MPTISVITPVHNGGHHYLDEAYQSLREQKLPGDWEWQWCIQEDGYTGITADILPEDPRISIESGLPARAAVARMHGLTRATGELIRNLDADDVLLPGALERDIETLERVPWCVSACLDLHQDGSTSPGPYDPLGGPVEPGRFFDEVLKNRLSVQTTTFAAHRPLVLALGGWHALTGAEGISLLLAAEVVAPGEFIAEPSTLYRKHPDQTTATDHYWNPAEAATRIEAGIQRAKALRQSGWTWT
ncbi:glycosyltransferase family 2 protein [Streptomyces tubercidicus]|uniref:Glycosyl transferase n=1 Tax=Streptomyces tubercidicus TaxID=47759 RepID=A0A640USG3_9ACTN|nr:glycosyltransferase [Streptomyces tubercidicus]WAU13373.1 glycosyltransferase [Streptomyces tubercidicus]GFE38963.1 glycosyl transferase [Streptomyces tubercidicus]